MIALADEGMTFRWMNAQPKNKRGTRICIEGFVNRSPPTHC